MDYLQYLKDYNEISAKPDGDYEEFVQKYYHPDIEVCAQGNQYIGRDGMKKSLEMAHIGVTEDMKLLNYAVKGDSILCEADAYLTAVDCDQPDYMVVPLLKGQAKAVRVFAAYTLKEGKVASLRVAWWPDEVKKA